MRILYGILSGFAGFALLWTIFAAGGRGTGVLAAFLVFFGATIAVLLWLVAGQPSSFSTTSQGIDARLLARIRLAMRIAAGPSGLLSAAILVAGCVAIVRVFYWSSVLADTPWWDRVLVILFTLFIAMWYLGQALMAWVLCDWRF